MPRIYARSRRTEPRDYPRPAGRLRFSPDDQDAFNEARDALLDEFTEDDITEFLLEWCPRKLSAPPEDSAGTCRAAGAFIEFLFRTRRLVGGADRAARLMTLADDLAPAMRDAMADSANIAKAARKAAMRHRSWMANRM